MTPAADKQRSAISPTEPTVLLHMLGCVFEDVCNSDALPEYDPGSNASLVAFVEHELGLKFHGSPKIMRIFTAIIDDVREGRIVRDAILGPRGGGKTQFAAALELVLWRFFGFDCVNVGGSLKQARKCYSYIREGGTDRSEVLRRHLKKEPTMTETKSKDGGFISIAAATDLGVRGEHPNGPSGGGMLALDEVALIKDNIVDAAKGQLSSAKPSVLVQLSTMGERQSGRWYELLGDVDHLGYRLWELDIFDVVETCAYDCATTCPVRDHFHGNHEDDEQPGYYESLGGVRERSHLPLCGGKAHDVNGHISVDEIARQFREMDLETFQREYMGVNTGVVGHVFDPALLAACSVDDIKLSEDPRQHQSRFQRLEKACGLDWGWDALSCACWAVRLRNTIVVYRWDIWDHTQFRKLRGYLLERSYAERVGTILPDGAEPSENDSMREDSDQMSLRMERDEGVEFSVTIDPVTFSKWKTYGYGEARRRTEARLVLFPKRFGGVPVKGYDVAMKMLRQHRRDANGKPAKKDDHPSDAFMCACLRWSQRYESAPSVG